ncbi:MAG: VWA domain-containing protein [Pyrinomonadaceae bacterium]
MLKYPVSALLVFIFAFTAASLCVAQQKPPLQSSPPAPIARDTQESVKIFTEEVRLPVAAYDDYGRFDPTVAPADILVLEDNVAQQVRSVRRVNANVLLLFDLGSQITASRSTNATRDIALRIIGSLRTGDKIAIVQNSRRVEVLQDWTMNAPEAVRAVNTKFFTSTRSRLSECLATAAAKLKEQPVGDTHLIIFTDGLESQGSERRSNHAEPINRDAIRKLIATQASLHVFSFAALVQQAATEHNKAVSLGITNYLPSVRIDTDLEMRRWFTNYARVTKESEERLVMLAQETGGRILMPASTEDSIKQADAVARDIGAQYVVTYTPKRPFAAAENSERRRVNVFPRRTGLELHLLRSHVSTPIP